MCCCILEKWRFIYVVENDIETLSYSIEIENENNEEEIEVKYRREGKFLDEILRGE